MEENGIEGPGREGSWIEGPGMEGQTDMQKDKR